MDFLSAESIKLILYFTYFLKIPNFCRLNLSGNTIIFNHENLFRWTAFFFLLLQWSSLRIWSLLFFLQVRIIIWIYIKPNNFPEISFERIIHTSALECRIFPVISEKSEFQSGKKKLEKKENRGVSSATMSARQYNWAK